MIVCDWNGTLFRDPLEERFFFGLCRLAFYKALRSGSLRSISSLIMRGLWCFREYLSAKGRGDKTLAHIARLIEILNPCVFAGIPKAELESYAWSYAMRIQDKLDMRLVWPLKQLVSDAEVPVAVISSGCREGIVPALGLVGLDVDDVMANEFVLDDEGFTEKFDFRITHNKAALLFALLERRGISAGDTMYIGDSRADEDCFREVGYPVASFFAAPAFRERAARMRLAYCPANQDDFRDYLQEVLT